MKNTIKSITRKQPQETILPDGYYNGICSGYCIELTSHGVDYELETEESVRGMGIRVVVRVQNGEATFEEIQN